MAADGVLGDVKVAYSLDSPVSWVELTQVLDIKFPTWVADEIDTTVMGVTKFKRKIPGMITVSDTQVTFLWDPDETTTPAHEAMFDLNIAGTSIWLRLEVAANIELTKWKAWEFKARVKSAEPSAPMNDKSTLVVNFAFDGEDIARYAAGASAIS